MLVAPDKFKATFSASQVAEAVASGLRAEGIRATELAVADGGEGTMQALISARGGTIEGARVRDPLDRDVEAQFALLDDGTAIVECAQASGLWRVRPEERDPWKASTRGTGELILQAQAAGAREVVVAVGGSATTDGGAGAIESLSEARIDCKLTVACDVRSSFEQAPRLYGPQKGADSEMVARLERRLDRLAEAMPVDPRGVELTGCAGGLSGALWAWYGADLVPGAQVVLDAIDFDAQMRGARFVVCGEGRLDGQTLFGKALAEIATRCRQAGVVCHAVVGANRLRRFDVRVLDLASVREATTLSELRKSGSALAQATHQSNLD